ATRGNLGDAAGAVGAGPDGVGHAGADTGAVTGEQLLERRIAAVNGDRVIAEAARHALDEPALHRIVVDNENGLGHRALGNCSDSSHFGRTRLRASYRARLTTC